MISWHPANPDHLPQKFSILIPSWNNLEYLKLCVHSIRQNSAFKHQIIIHVNEGYDGTLQWVKEEGLDYTFSPVNIGICFALNAGRKLVRTDYMVYINDDMYLLPNWDQALWRRIQDIGHNWFFLSSSTIEPYTSKHKEIIAPYDYGTDIASFKEDDLLRDFASLSHQNWLGATWPPNIVHRDLWDLVGGYSTEFSPGLYSDPDFSRKLYQAGVRIFEGLSESRTYHFGSKSTKRFKMNGGSTQFLQKWGTTSSFFTQKVIRRGQTDNTMIPQAITLPLKHKLKCYFKKLMRDVQGINLPAAMPPFVPEKTHPVPAKMHLGAILPHTRLYGGVKRFLELGNVFMARGHSFTIFTPDGAKPDWFSFHGNILPLEQLPQHHLSAVFFTEPRFIPNVLGANARRKIFYFVGAHKSLNPIKKHPEIAIFANSTNLLHRARKRFGVEAFPAIGGINLNMYPLRLERTNDHPERAFTVMAFGRIAEGSKGTKYVIEACEYLVQRGRNIRLLLFDSPQDARMQHAMEQIKTHVPLDFYLNHPIERNYELFHQADVFVAPERKTGWSNTAVEAMACGVPVIGTTSGTLDFLKHEQTGIVVKRSKRQIASAIERLIDDPDTRLQYGLNARKQVEKYNWEQVADRILYYLKYC